MSAQQYDLVLDGGRFMDAETGMDAVRNVGIREGKKVRISSDALSGRHVVHAERQRSGWAFEVTAKCICTSRLFVRYCFTVIVVDAVCVV